ncbi:hypothetical protein [Lysinibacillus piscis]|uniref:DUF4181 domain-containing protein n=1 Tax=Lysinibacillus piscis TaxID=2518931 RepID=A0ABQ5NNK0_9BACI|nr:hypothetical protein [Lysinibacillus sp. KH24]GLC89888.1 hypothetical protein LYSBPC_30150 [Lysinibacillus sp. KH24]
MTKEKTWQHLRELAPTKQQQNNMLREIRLSKKATSWKISAVSLLFIAVLTILALSFLQTPLDIATTTDEAKEIAKIYVRDNDKQDRFLAKASCLYVVAQKCYKNQDVLLQFQQAMATAKSPPPMSLVLKQDVLIVYTDGTQEQWKVAGRYMTNIHTQQVIQLEQPVSSLLFVFRDQMQLLLGYGFLFLSHFILWITKHKVPHIKRRAFAANVEHMIANGVMLLLFAILLATVYFLTATLHAFWIYGAFIIYSTMQVYYRKKAGEPRIYILACALNQLCIGLAFTILFFVY